MEDYYAYYKLKETSMKKKTKNLPYFMYGNKNNLYGFAMLQKRFYMVLYGFIWIILCVQNISRITKDFIKKYDEDNDIGYIFEVEHKYFEQYGSLINNLPFHQEKKKVKKFEKTYL